MNYPHTMPPFDHQDVEQKEHWDTPGRAIFWEQGLGKMKAGYDWAMTLWQAGLIDTLVVVSPNGVHLDWIKEATKTPSETNPYDQPLVPPMWHDQIDFVTYETKKAGTKWHQKKMKDAFYSEKMVVVSMSYDAVKTEKSKSTGWIGGKLFCAKMVRDRRTAFLIDEAAEIQTPGTKITKTLVGHGGKGGIARFAKYRRIMEGTPVDEGPFNIYPQMQFLDQEFWRDRGFASFQSFKTYFGIWKDVERADGRHFPMLLRYQNLDELHDILKPHSSRLLKQDCLDLPEKQYTQHRFEMSKQQWDAYEQIRDELMIEAQADGEDLESLITAELPIVNVLKLYQITCGYLPFIEDEDGEPVQKVVTFKENPRLEMATSILRRQTKPVLIWCKFTRDLELLQEAFGKDLVRYDGKTDQEEREANKAAWLSQSGPQFLAAQTQAMYRGHTLNIAPYVMYYSNDSRLRLRRQSEDRTHRGRMDFSVLYGDMMATDTVDEKRVRKLREKLQVAEKIMGDNQ